MVDVLTLRVTARYTSPRQLFMMTLCALVTFTLCKLSAHPWTSNEVLLAWLSAGAYWKLSDLKRA